MTALVSSEAKAPAQNRLSVSQMLHVMRVEFHRARSQRYPLVCVMVAVDGLDEIQESGGYARKQAAMRAAYDALRKVTSEQAFFGMALMSGDRIMAIFPNLAPTRGSELGRLMIEAARAARIAGDGDALVLSLSLGAAHNLLAETNSSFEGIVEMAGRALALAREGGGGRYVMWREAEAELDELRGELAARTQAFKEQHAVLSEEISGIGDLQRSVVLDKMQAVFASAPRTSEIAALEKEILALAATELYEERQKAVQAQVAEHQREIDMLERRIAKLTSILGVTEDELKRVMSLKSIDPGVASIYSTVQGLSSQDEQAEVKQAMMAVIFQANLAFQKPRETAGKR